MTLRIGCAGWNIPKTEQGRFVSSGSQLERYASALAAVEINSSFYRSHRPATYARWAANVPGDFRFSAKLPKTITHQNRLQDVALLAKSFVAEVSELGGKLGPLLVQLPPSLNFDPAVARNFFQLIRDNHAGQIACEPRHPSWFTTEADVILSGYQVARVAADPACVAAAAEPGAWGPFYYFRLHGSPRIYYSAYSEAYLAELTRRLCALADQAETWCIFDNTALGAAAVNALNVLALTLRQKCPATGIELEASTAG